MQINQTPKFCFRLFLLASFCLFLSGCGFHLRGNNALTPEVRTLYLKTNNPYGLFEERLERTFNMYGLTFVDQPTAAPLTLQIINSNLSYFQTTVGSSSQATIYSVTYTVNMAILAANGKTIVPPQNIVSNAFLTLNPNQLLTSNNQIDILGQQLQIDVINRIVDILNSPEVEAAITHKNMPLAAKKQQHHRSRHEN